MYGGSVEVFKLVWLQLFFYVIDFDKVKVMMKEVGFEFGFEIILLFDMGMVMVGEFIVILIQESLVKIGIKMVIDKIFGVNWWMMFNKKEFLFVFNCFSGWFDYFEYYFYWNFYGNNLIFNILFYQDKDMDVLIDKVWFIMDVVEYD